MIPRRGEHEAASNDGEQIAYTFDAWRRTVELASRHDVRPSVPPGSLELAPGSAALPRSPTQSRARAAPRRGESARTAASGARTGGADPLGPGGNTFPTAPPRAGRGRSPRGPDRPPPA